MDKPLYNALKKYSDGNPSRFHMPAHFGCDVDGGLYASAKYDITELDFSDNLQSPQGLILASEKNAAKAYGSQKSLYFTSGATTAIFTALAAARSRGSKLIMPRGAHKSVYSAVRMLNYTPVYMPTRTRSGLIEPQTAADVANALDKHPDAAAVLVTSPTYYGKTCDARAIAAVVKERNALLICDQAHGAHFAFSPLFKNSFSQAADLCIESLHKTLPVYGGGAVLNVNNGALIEKTISLRADFHTTSPSYVILASMDFAVSELYDRGEQLYADLYEKTYILKKCLPQLNFYENDDFTRLVVKLTEKGIQRIKEKGIIPEAEVGEWAVFILSPYNQNKLDELKNALSDEQSGDSADSEEEFGCMENDLNDTSLTAKSFDCSNNFEFVPLEQSAGRISAREAGLYPPGVPIIAAGERISTKAVKILCQGKGVFGLVNGKICVII